MSQNLNPKARLTEFTPTSPKSDILGALEWRCSQDNNDPSNLREVEAFYLAKLLDIKAQRELLKEQELYRVKSIEVQKRLHQELLDKQDSHNKKILRWQVGLVIATWVLVIINLIVAF